MTVNDKTAKSQTDAISFELDLPHAPAKVWRALTEPELLAEWLLPVVDRKLELTPAAAFKLQGPVMPGWDGVVSCRVLEVEAQRKLRYTWVVGGMELETVVTFSLVPTASGSRLTIEQSGFKPEQKQNWGGARYGWKMMGGKLIDLLGRVG